MWVLVTARWGTFSITKTSLFKHIENISQKKKNENFRIKILIFSIFLLKGAASTVTLLPGSVKNLNR